MDRTERFYKIDQLLRERKVVPFSLFVEKLDVSRATIKRDLEYLRNRLHAPIVWDRIAGGYCFESQPHAVAQYELPGLWFSASEIHALLTMQHLLAGIDSGGLLASHVEPLKTRLGMLLATDGNDGDEIRKRIRVLDMAVRSTELAHFANVGSALLRRKRLLLRYYTRGRGETLEREVSPQRLVYYRGNWYLDAWCHLREGLRSFSVDAIRGARVLDSAARNVSENTLDAELGAGYGIFSGRKISWAKLRFSSRRARWVAAERWHPRQKGRLLDDGTYLLEIPYSDSRELLMDILKHGPEVEVLAPQLLKDEVVSLLQQTVGLYGVPAG
ncbi:MAG: YafY family transcriptional regulator [Proteobacteria bacterium]|nr:YafY family transcriptional regulator [Pseudomonadota bacterium]HQR04963.1 YafY family protein [Rhodocyclaceae bacterium]